MDDKPQCLKRGGKVKGKKGVNVKQVVNVYVTKRQGQPRQQNPKPPAPMYPPFALSSPDFIRFSSMSQNRIQPESYNSMIAGPQVNKHIHLKNFGVQTEESPLEKVSPPNEPLRIIDREQKEADEPIRLSMETQTNNYEDNRLDKARRRLGIIENQLHTKIPISIDTQTDSQPINMETQTEGKPLSMYEQDRLAKAKRRLEIGERQALGQMEVDRQSTDEIIKLSNLLPIIDNIETGKGKKGTTKLEALVFKELGNIFPNGLPLTEREKGLKSLKNYVISNIKRKITNDEIKLGTTNVKPTGKF
jgi:hypothetical protein